MKQCISLILIFNCFIAGAQVREYFAQATNSTILIFKKDQGNLVPHGTAFSFYNYDSPEENILVTCEHLTHHDTLIASIPASDSIKKAFTKSGITRFPFYSKKGINYIEFDGNNFLFTIPLALNINLFVRADLDLAVIFCVIPSVLSDTTGIINLTNSKRLPKSYIGKKDEIYPGQDVMFIGFPYGIGTPAGFLGTNTYSDLRSNPLVRKGMVSWTSENSDLLLVDGFSYTGNSGSPIFSVPPVGVDGRFVGMVIGHLNDNFEIDNITIDTVKKTLAPGKTKYSNK